MARNPSPCPICVVATTLEQAATLCATLLLAGHGRYPYGLATSKHRTLRANRRWPWPQVAALAKGLAMADCSLSLLPSL
ncbi:hypothetical protein BHE74_00044418 [Ensete ventricosum]|nr:hypothetical protein BHE74_00044418 [Ensete ventricosum]